MLLNGFGYLLPKRRERFACYRHEDLPSCCISKLQPDCLPIFGDNYTDFVRRNNGIRFAWTLKLHVNPP